VWKNKILPHYYSSLYNLRAVNVKTKIQLRGVGLYCYNEIKNRKNGFPQGLPTKLCELREKLTAIDKKIGLRIKQIRKSWGLSQIELAEKVGLSFQQIQKYEKGVTRISVFRLQQISEALGVSIASFFENEPTPTVSEPTQQYAPQKRPLVPFQFPDKEEIVILKLFRQIKNQKLRESFLKQLRGIIELQNERRLRSSPENNKRGDGSRKKRK